MRYVFDLDGTLCTSTESQYSAAEPIEQRIKFLNDLYDSGHHITILTARGMSTYKNDAKKAHDRWYDLTKEQLSSWGVKHHELFLGKPAGDFYIDDKAVKDVEFFSEDK